MSVFIIKCKCTWPHMYNPLAVPLVYFLYSRGCGRYGFGRHSPPCGHHGLILGNYRLWPSLLWPSLFVAVMVWPS